MLRYIFALLIVLLLPTSLADPLDSSRDANLAPLTSFCPFVAIDSDNTALTQMKEAVEKALLDRAVLYGVPLHSSCQATDNYLALIVTALNTSAASNGFMMMLDVVVDDGSSTYQLPTVWENATIVAGPIDQLPDRLEQSAKDIFDSFALAWKKQQ